MSGIFCNEKLVVEDPRDTLIERIESGSEQTLEDVFLELTTDRTSGESDAATTPY